MKTIALNMIVGPNEAMELDRCLSSVDNIFDEIVIVCTTNDEKVHEVACKYTDKVLTKEWTSERYPHGDFAGARNLAIENTKSDYIHWLDADDTADEEYRTKFTGKIKHGIANGDIKHQLIFIRYAITFDAFGNVSEDILVPRVFKNDPRIRWQFPVHEQIKVNDYSYTSAIFNKLSVKHAPVKPAMMSINRNLEILEHEMKAEPSSHIIYYYAKELLVAYRHTKVGHHKFQSMRHMKAIVESRDALKPNLCDICTIIASESLYMRESKTEASINHAGVQEAETYAHTALSFSERAAQPYVVLGDICVFRHRFDEAIAHFKNAMSKKAEETLSADIAYYEEIPARRLMAIFWKKDQPELALWYSRLVLGHSPDDKLILEARTEILKELTSG